MNNKQLTIITIILFFIAVISFFNKKVETNFLLPQTPEMSINIKLKFNDSVVELPLEEYIIGVVSGEMPASFELEALKAQAIASRTYALYKHNISDGFYDLTSDTSSQVYFSDEECRAKWGEDYDKYHTKIESAVNDTKNIIMTYNNEIIESFYFAMSNGSTQNSETVFKETKNYLQEVESVYDNENINNYKVTKEFTKEEFISKLELQCDRIVLNNLIKYDTNYVNSVSVCDKTYTGVEFRQKLGLRSSSFDIEITDNVTITTYGYGHGVGMSQYGANGYAKNGYSYEEILKHYYKNIELNSLLNV